MALTVTYFDIRGLAEMIRLLLTDKQIAFEDKRLSREEWPEYKSKMTFGQVPCLTVGDEQLVQTGTIMRHLGRLHGLAGQNEAEATFIDMFFEGIRDLHSKYVRVIYENYEAGKEPFIKDVLPDQLAALEKLFMSHCNGDHFVAGDKESYADYALFEELDVLLTLTPHALDNFPKFKRFYEKFSERPQLKGYLNKRASLNVPVNGNGKQ